jgi:hypothetical protein
MSRTRFLNRGFPACRQIRSLDAGARAEPADGSVRRLHAARKGSFADRARTPLRRQKGKEQPRLRRIVGRMPLARDRARDVDGLRLSTVLHRGGLPRWLPEAVQKQRWENPEDENPSRDQHRIHERARVAKL